MARDEMLTVFCYDVSGNAARRRVAEVLESAAVRVQESVFEARLGAKAAAALAEHAAIHLGIGDSLRVYAVGRRGHTRCRVFGRGHVAECHDFWLV